MIINQTSKIQDILQAVKGTLCKAGNNVLPKTFIEQRTDITPYLVFEKDKVLGGIITSQEQYVTLENNGLVLIIQS